MSAARRLEILQWSVRARAWIIEDDYDGEFRFDSRPIGALQGLDTDSNVVYVGTFSKVLFPALRLGYVVVPKDMVAAFSAVREASDLFSSTLYQAVLTDFIRKDISLAIFDGCVSSTWRGASCLCRPSTRSSETCSR